MMNSSSGGGLLVATLLANPYTPSNCNYRRSYCAHSCYDRSDNFWFHAPLITS
jgi:hypothetical protein